MVLFKEDDRRIREQEKQERLAKRTRLGVWSRRFAKAGLVMAVLFGVSLTLLSTLGGSNEALKKGIEDYLTQAMGMQAEIGEFKNMAFFPDLDLDAGKIVFRREEQGPPVLTVGTVRFSAGFFDLMFSRQRIELLTLENVDVRSGVWGDKAVSLDVLALRKDGEDKPGLVLKGRYGGQDLSVFLAMDVLEKGGGRFVYKMPDDAAFSARLGSVKAEGAVKKAPWGNTTVTIAELGPDKEAIAGTISVRRGVLTRKVQADLAFGGSVMKAALKLSKKTVRGTVVFPVLKLEDTGIPGRIYAALAQDSEKEAESKGIGFGGWTADVAVSVDDLRSGEGALGAFRLPVRVADGVLTAGPLSGAINGGTLSGQAVLNASSGSAASLDMNAGLKGWDFGQYQKALFGRENVSGKADIRLAVKGSGENGPALLRTLDGEAVMIAGEGRFASAALNIWGGGLVRAMLPDLSPDDLTVLNCMIADFKIEDGIARPDPFFMDTARVTVVGDGTVSLPDNRIDIKLEPKSKDPALLDVASAVSISGSILSPSIGADGFSLFEKLGGLALGVVNPAFLVFSLTDLGLGESHPCRQFIGGAGKADKKSSAPEEAQDKKPEPERSEPNQ